MHATPSNCSCCLFITFPERYRSMKFTVKYNVSGTSLYSSATCSCIRIYYTSRKSTMKHLGNQCKSPLYNIRIDRNIRWIPYNYLNIIYLHKPINENWPHACINVFLNSLHEVCGRPLPCLENPRKWTNYMKKRQNNNKNQDLKSYLIMWICSILKNFGPYNK